MIDAPYPVLDELITSIGEAGQRLSEFEASEGAAGNISVFIGWPIDPRRRFPLVENIVLPLPAPELAGFAFLISGSGRRLREIIKDPAANLGCLVIEEGGQSGRLYTSPQRLFTNLTSEFNSHLAVHRDQVVASGTNFHAVVHAQPPHLTYLSFLARYQDPIYLNRHILSWQPELIIQLPEGVGIVPFLVPGSPQLMEATMAALRKHRIVVWSKHGVVARSDVSVKRASDRIEYAETGARYEYMNLATGEQAEGLSPEEIRSFCQDLGVQQSIF
jgi:rhamnulose-1-phosphate aldolase